MDWWQGFWGWLITVALAGTAAAGVVVGEIRRRRERAWVTAAPPYGTIDLSDGRRAEVCSLVNSGTVDAHVLSAFVVGGEIVFPREDLRIPSVLRSSQETPVAFVADDPEKVWMLIMWLHRREGRSYAQLRWQPLRRDGALSDELHRQIDARTGLRGWWRRWKWRLTGKPQWSVGPDGVPGARIRVGQSERLRAALAEVPRPAETAE